MCCTHLNRREFLGASTGLIAGAAFNSASLLGVPPSQPDDRWDPHSNVLIAAQPLRVQPVLMYHVPTRRKETSWKSWGGVQSDEAATVEAAKIFTELKDLAKHADFPTEIMPVLKISSESDASQLAAKGNVVTVLYPATGSGVVLKACLQNQNTVIFLRHKSGPVYYWYEALSTNYIRPASDNNTPENAVKDERLLSVNDVVVDDYAELQWRLRALYAVRNFMGSRIVAVGGPMGKYASEAPARARDVYKFDIVDVSYDDVSARLKQAFADSGRMAQAERWADSYLAIPHTTLDTERRFVVNAFVLYSVFKDLLREHNASLFTIKECMSTIIPMAQTTACLTLSLMNDEGLGAFCESDFVIIPAGIMMRYITSKPVFLHNSTFPHKGVVTCAHCTGPRRMDGRRYDPAKIVTHFESEYGAAPKVSMPVGQEVTFIDPEYAKSRWVGFKGTVESNPFYEICRSQQDVRIHGHWEKLLNEIRDSHWVMSYGDHLKEIGYAVNRLGIQWDNISVA